MLIDVRRAMPQDIDFLMSRLEMLSDYTGTDKKLFEDNDYSRNGMLNLIDKHIVYIACIDSRPIGFIGGYFVPHPFNPKVTMLSELFWWVDEDERGSRAGSYLLKSFIDYGKKNADWIVFGLNTKTPVKEETILRLGFKRHEVCYLLETSKGD
jgi:hypothetical protein